MLDIRSRKLSMAIPFVLVLGVSLAGCFGDSGSSKKETADATTSRSEAANAIATALNTAARAIDGASEEVTMKAMTAKGLVSVPVPKRVQEQFDGGLKKTLARVRSSAARYTKRSVAQHGDTVGGATAHDEDVVVAAEIEQYLVNPTVSGNTVTFRINTALACEGETGADLTQCTNTLANVTIVLTRDSSTAGTLDIQYKSNSLLKIGYAPGSVYFEANFGTIKTLGDDVEGDTGGSATGALRLTIAVENATEGSEKVSITLGVTEAIDIVDHHGGEVRLDAAASALQVAADNATDTLTLSVGFGAIHVEDVYCALGYDEDSCPEDLTHDLVHFNALTGNFAFSTGMVVATNVGVGGEAYSDEGHDDVKDEVLTMDTLGFTVEAGALPADPDTVTADTALNATTADLDSSVKYEAPAGTVLSVYELYDDFTMMYFDVMKVTAVGPFSVTGTGTKAGVLVANVGECFTDSGTPFPVVATGCP